MNPVQEKLLKSARETERKLGRKIRAALHGPMSKLVDILKEYDKAKKIVDELEGKLQ